ncbi:MAG TPA: TolC family protein [Candidatus Bathyarchaeia archaeon]|nr:TolC family protein [Candidatus Bathyarchaeia archaeon]
MRARARTSGKAWSGRERLAILLAGSALALFAVRAPAAPDAPAVTRAAPDAGEGKGETAGAVVETGSGTLGPSSAVDDAARPAVAPAPRVTPPLKAELLELVEFIRRAVEHAPDVVEARLDVVTREAKLREAKAARFFPEANVTSLTGAAPRARGTVLDPQDTVTTNALGPFTRVDINIVQPIFTGGKITAGIAAATHAVEQQAAASQGKVGEVVEQVKTLYYNILLARSVGGTLDEARDAFTSALATARKRREQGDSKISELDILYLRVGLAEVAKEKPKLDTGAIDALEALRRMIGADRTDPIDLKERFLQPVKADLQPLEFYEARLFEHSPSWKQLEAGIKAKSEELKTVEADFFPSVFVDGVFGYSYAPRRDRQLNPFAYDDFNYLHGPGAVLGIHWGLNFYLTAARAETTRAELSKLETQKRSAQSGLPLELRETYRKVQQTRDALDQLTDGRKAGRAILTLAVTNFDVGVGDAKDILDGLGNYARISSDYFEAARDYNLALAALTRVVGEEVGDLKER